ncbi:MAG: MFS transporter [Deltaproteobacteria bacterium]|nr:MFS transporter [Deltaproteobacteria bacterium]
MERKLFYGWYVLAASFLMLVLEGGVRFSFGILISPLAAEFSWSRAAITLAFTANMLVFGFSQLLAGKLLDRFGPRVVFSTSAMIVTAGMILTARMNSLVEFYLYYGVITAVGVSGITVGVVASTLSRWFRSMRGFISGVAISGTALGQFLIIPAIAFLMGRFGWRMAWGVAGLFLSLVVVPIAVLVLRKEPSETGPQRSRSGGERGPQEAVSDPDIPQLGVSQILRSRNFIVICLTYFICGFQDFLYVTQLIPFALDRGLSNQEASNLQGLAGFLSVPGLLFFSFLSEKLGRKIPLSLTFVPRFLSFALLFYSTEKPFIYAYALLFGFTLMASAPLAPAIVGDLYGFKNIGTLTGTIFWIHHLGGALGAYVGGLVYDVMGSYRLAFAFVLFLAVIAVLTSVLILEKRSPVPKY